MRLAFLTVSLMISALGCKLDNPAFEDGQEFADENGTFETSDAEQDAGSKDESGASDQDSNASNTLDGSSTIGEESTSSDDASTVDSSTTDPSTTDDATSSSDDGMSSSESTSESSSEESGSSSEDTLDGPIMACPITDIVDCKTCIQSNCCFEESDMACLDGTDMQCTCALDCLIDTNAMVNCGDACGAGDAALAHANAMYTCTLNFCDDWCP